MKKQRILKNTKPAFIKIIFLLIAVCLLTTTCKKDPLFEGFIDQPPGIHTPVNLPDTIKTINKLKGEFTPLLMGAKCDWRIASKRYYDNQPWGNCQSDPETTTFKNKTINELKGVSVKYTDCQWNVGDVTYKPDFSAPITSYFAAYKGAGEQQDIDGKTHKWKKNGNNDVKYQRYFTVLDVLPEAYIMKEEYWVIVPQLDGKAYLESSPGENGQISIKQTATKGFSKTDTEQWGYTVGGTIGASADVVSGSLTASFNKSFSTSLTYTVLNSSEWWETGVVPKGKTSYRLQTFQRMGRFTLVNKDGSPYGETGNEVYHPEIVIDLYTHTWIWYY